MVVVKNIASTTHFGIIFEEPILNTLTVAATTEGEKEGQQPQDWTSHQRWIETLTTCGHIGKAPALLKSAVFNWAGARCASIGSAKRSPKGSAAGKYSLSIRGMHEKQACQSLRI